MFNGSAYAAAAATVAGVVSGVDSAPANSLDGIYPTLTYYVGSSTSGRSCQGAPTLAGTYTVVASFAGSPDYQSASSSAVTFTIGRGLLTIRMAAWRVAGNLMKVAARPRPIK